jgi:hypothetical protein
MCGRRVTKTLWFAERFTTAPGSCLKISGPFRRKTGMLCIRASLMFAHRVIVTRRECIVVQHMYTLSQGCMYEYVLGAADK